MGRSFGQAKENKIPKIEILGQEIIYMGKNVMVRKIVSKLCRFLTERPAVLENGRLNRPQIIYAGTYNL